jgi:hypothetical protein
MANTAAVITIAVRSTVTSRRRWAIIGMMKRTTVTAAVKMPSTRPMVLAL